MAATVNTTIRHRVIFHVVGKLILQKLSKLIEKLPNVIIRQIDLTGYLISQIYLMVPKNREGGGYQTIRSVIKLKRYVMRAPGDHKQYTNQCFVENH